MRNVGISLAFTLFFIATPYIGALLIATRETMIDEKVIDERISNGEITH